MTTGDVMVDAYDDYLSSYHEAHNVESGANSSSRRCHELELMIRGKDDGGLPVRPSAHSIARSATRVEHLISVNSLVYDDVVGRGGYKFFLPTNLFIFMSEKILDARITGSYVREGLGYKYTTRITEWSDNETAIDMIACVEGGSIKTVYFNIVSAE